MVGRYLLHGLRVIGMKRRVARRRRVSDSVAAGSSPYPVTDGRRTRDSLERASSPRWPEVTDSALESRERACVCVWAHSWNFPAQFRRGYAPKNAPFWTSFRFIRKSNRC